MKGGLRSMKTHRTSVLNVQTCAIPHGYIFRTRVWLLQGEILKIGSDVLIRSTVSIPGTIINILVGISYHGRELSRRVTALEGMIHPMKAIQRFVTQLPTNLTCGSSRDSRWGRLIFW
jgi:hypothetical protein